MSWIDLHQLEQLNEIERASFERTQVIFKHSTRCSISTMAKARLDKEAFPSGADFYYLDLIAHRNISNEIAEKFKVWHESPQVLVIKNGECIYDESHMGISWQGLTASL
jgi:bacillithiol system protein YtxJ